MPKRKQITPDEAPSSVNNDTITPDEAPSSSVTNNTNTNTNTNTIVVEFKFRSDTQPTIRYPKNSPLSTPIVKDHVSEFEGFFHMPLRRDPGSGLFSLPPHDKVVEFPFVFTTFEGSQSQKRTLTARLARNHHNGKPGLTLVEFLPSRDVHTVLPADNNDEEGGLDRWATRAGGELVFQIPQNDGQDPHLLTLCTVLSETWPSNNTDRKRLPTIDEPNWKRLETVVAARHHVWEGSIKKSKLVEYQKFLALKIQHEDWNSELFTPSPVVDQVWHAHLAFSDHYHQDVQALAKQLLDQPPPPVVVVKHSPCLFDEAEQRYKRTIVQLKKNNGGRVLNKTMWPNPSQVYPQDHSKRKYVKYVTCG